MLDILYGSDILDRMKRFLVGILPYMIALAVGVIIYIVADTAVKDEGLNSLFVNIASGLISIPLVFISYEAISKMTSRNLRNSLFQSIISEINGSIENLIRQMAIILNLKRSTLTDLFQAFTDMDDDDIREKLHAGKIDVAELEKINTSLNQTAHKQAAIEILSESQTMTILTLSKEVHELSKKAKFSKNKASPSPATKKEMVKNIVNIGNLTQTWAESIEKDVAENHARIKTTE